jgi:hypothetical protein
VRAVSFRKLSCCDIAHRRCGLRAMRPRHRHVASSLLERGVASRRCACRESGLAEWRGGRERKDARPDGADHIGTGAIGPRERHLPPTVGVLSKAIADQFQQFLADLDAECAHGSVDACFAASELRPPPMIQTYRILSVSRIGRSRRKRRTYLVSADEAP